MTFYTVIVITSSSASAERPRYWSHCLLMTAKYYSQTFRPKSNNKSHYSKICYCDVKWNVVDGRMYVYHCWCRARSNKLFIDISATWRMQLKWGEISGFKVYWWKDTAIKHGLIDATESRQRPVVNHRHRTFACLSTLQHRHPAAMMVTWRSHKPLATTTALVGRVLPAPPLRKSASRRRLRKPEVVNDVVLTAVHNVVEGTRKHFRSGWRLRQNL